MLNFRFCKKNILKYLYTGLCFLCMFELYSESSNLSLSISPKGTFRYGEINEYVYTDGIKLSQLDWDIKPLWLFGAEVDFQYKSFITQLSFLAALPLNSGLMQDYDWLLLDEQLTNFSEHSLKTEKQINFSAFVGLEVYKNNKISIVPKIGYEYLSTVMMAYDGYYQHPDSNNNPTPMPHEVKEWSGKAISYNQNLDLFWLSTNLSFSFNKIISAMFEIQYSPLIGALCYDYHYYQNSDAYTKYVDTPKGYVAMKYLLQFDFNITKRMSVLLNGSYFSLPKILGNTCIQNYMSSSYYKQSSEGGTAYRAWDISLSYRIRIL